MTEQEQKVTSREVADMSLKVVAGELSGAYCMLQAVAKQRKVDLGILAAADREVALLEGMALGIDLQGDGLIPSGDVTVGGPYQVCVIDMLYGKMETLLGKPIRPRMGRVSSFEKVDNGPHFIDGVER